MNKIDCCETSCDLLESTGKVTNMLVLSGVRICQFACKTPEKQHLCLVCIASYYIHREWCCCVVGVVINGS